MTQTIHKSKKKTLSNIRNKHNKSKKKIINLQDGGAGVLRYLKTKVGSVMGTDTIEPRKMKVMSDLIHGFSGALEVARVSFALEHRILVRVRSRGYSAHAPLVT